MQHFEREVVLHAVPGRIADEAHRTDGLLQVVFDSFSRPVLARTRTGPMSAMGVREIVLRAEPYQIDLHVEAHAERNRLVVTGQLLDVNRPDKFGVDVLITLSNLRGRAVLAATNQFGEFRGELENSGDLEFSFLDHSGKRIVVLLRGALKASSPVRQ